MTNRTNTRIAVAASRLSQTTVSRRSEKQLAKQYVRNSIALDPDTSLARRRAAK